MRLQVVACALALSVLLGSGEADADVTLTFDNIPNDVHCESAWNESGLDLWLTPYDAATQCAVGASSSGSLGGQYAILNVDVSSLQGLETIEVQLWGDAWALSLWSGSELLTRAFTVDYPFSRLDVRGMQGDRFEFLIWSVYALEIRFIGATVVDAPPTPGGGPRLLANYPNPFNPSTTISWILPSAQHAKVDIVDLRGRVVMTLFDDEMSAGVGSVRWNGVDYRGGAVASGVYLCRLNADGAEDVRRIVLLK